MAEYMEAYAIAYGYVDSTDEQYEMAWKLLEEMEEK